MKKFLESKPGRAAIALALALLATLCAQPARSQLVAQGTSLTQAAGVVTPRTYVVVSNLNVTNSAGFTAGTITNTGAIASLLGAAWPTWLTNQSVYALAPTLIPPYGSHGIGITVIIANSNKFSAASNMVVNLYPAYDTTGGSASSVSPRYGQLFGAAPLLSWTIAYQTNGTWTTNLTGPQWECATSIGYTITNQAPAVTGVASNIFVTILQSDAP